MDTERQDVRNRYGFTSEKSSQELVHEKRTSKTKKVKNYLKKCKRSANSLIQNNNERNVELSSSQPNFFKRYSAVEESVPHTSWYVTDEFYLDEEPKSHVTVVQMMVAAKNSVQTAECDAVAVVNSADVLEATTATVRPAITADNVIRNAAAADDERNRNVVDCSGKAEGSGDEDYHCNDDNDSEEDTTIMLENFVKNFMIETVVREEPTTTIRVSI